MSKSKLRKMRKQKSKKGGPPNANAAEEQE